MDGSTQELLGTHKSCSPLTLLLDLLSPPIYLFLRSEIGLLLLPDSSSHISFLLIYSHFLSPGTFLRFKSTFCFELSSTSFSPVF